MGGTTFEQVQYGTNVNQVFDALTKEAIYHDGNNSYNGTISTTSLGTEINLSKYPKLAKALEQKDFETMDEYYEDVLYPEKRVSNYISELAYYNVCKPEWVEEKENVTRKKGCKMLKEFGIMTQSKYDKNSISFKSYPTLTEAKKNAKQLSLKENEDVIVFQYRSVQDGLRKEKVKLGKFKLVSEGKQNETKVKSKNKAYMPVYKFTFFVFAAT